MLDGQSPYVMVGAAAAAFAALWLIEPLVSRRRLARWCDGEGLRLVSWRGARFYEGPRRFWRTEDEDTYRIEVEDVRSGVVRRGYVRFDSRFWPFRSQQIVAEWDGAESL